MILRFCSGSMTSSSAAEEAVARLHVHEVDGELPTERLLHLLGLVKPQQPVVDEHARELVADGLVDERGRDRGVDAAGEPADDPFRPDLRAHLVDRLLDDRRVGPRGAAVAHVEQEPLEDLLAALGVRDLGVELHAVDAAFAVLERGDRRARGGRGDDEAVGRADDGVAVAHPHDLLDRQAFEEHRAAIRSRVSSVRPYSPLPVSRTSPPSCCATSCAP